MFSVIVKEHILHYYNSPEPKASGRLCVRASTLALRQVGQTQSNPKASLGRGKAALGFGPDLFRTLVSMATYSSYRVIMGKML